MSAVSSRDLLRAVEEAVLFAHQEVVIDEQWGAGMVDGEVVLIHYNPETNEPDARFRLRTVGFKEEPA